MAEEIIGSQRSEVGFQTSIIETGYIKLHIAAQSS